MQKDKCGISQFLRILRIWCSNNRFLMATKNGQKMSGWFTSVYHNILYNVTIHRPVHSLSLLVAYIIWHHIYWRQFSIKCLYRKIGDKEILYIWIYGFYRHHFLQWLNYLLKDIFLLNNKRKFFAPYIYLSSK